MPALEPAPGSVPHCLNASLHLGCCMPLPVSHSKLSPHALHTNGCTLSVHCISAPSCTLQLLLRQAVPLAADGPASCSSCSSSKHQQKQQQQQQQQQQMLTQLQKMMSCHMSFSSLTAAAAAAAAEGPLGSCVRCSCRSSARWRVWLVCWVCQCSSWRKCSGTNWERRSSQVCGVRVCVYWGGGGVGDVAICWSGW